MLSQHAARRVYFDGWQEWEDRLWLYAARQKGGRLLLYATKPYRRFPEWIEAHAGPWHPVDWLSEQHEVILSFIQRSLERAKEQINPLGLTDAMFKGKWPALAEFMTVGVLPNGDKRDTSKITVFYEHGFFKAFLNDPHSRMSLCVSSVTFLGLLDALEGAIKSDAPGWRPMPDYGAKKGKKS